MLAPVILKIRALFLYLSRYDAWIAEEFKASLPLPVLMQGEMGNRNY